MSCGSRTTSSFRCTISGLSYPYNSTYYGDVAWYKNRTASGSTFAQNQSLSQTFSGYSAGATNDVSAKIWWKDPDNGGAAAGWVTIGGSGTYYTWQTKCATPSYSSSSKTASSITVNFNSVTGAESYQIYCYTTDTYKSGRSATFTGLNPDTTYKFRCKAFATSVSDADSAWSSDTSITTDAGVPSTPSGYVSITSRIEGGVNLSWNSSSGATGYTLAYKYSYESSFSTVNVTGTTYQLTGRACGVEHIFKVRANNAQGSSSYTAESLGTTLPRSPTVSSPAQGPHEIDAEIGNMDGNWEYVLVWIESVSQEQTLYKTDWDSGQRRVTFTGLNQGHSYNIKAQAYFHYNGTDFWSYSIRETNATTTSRPSNFGWDTSKSSGSNFNLTASEWNRLTSKINEFRAYKGLSSYSFTTASTGANFTATIFNQARNAIADMNTSSLPGTTGTGSTVNASNLNALRDTLNAIT